MYQIPTMLYFKRLIVECLRDYGATSMYQIPTMRHNWFQLYPFSCLTFYPIWTDLSHCQKVFGKRLHVMVLFRFFRFFERSLREEKRELFILRSRNTYMVLPVLTNLSHCDTVFLQKNYMWIIATIFMFFVRSFCREGRNFTFSPKNAQTIYRKPRTPWQGCI